PPAACGDGAAGVWPHQEAGTLRQRRPATDYPAVVAAAVDVVAIVVVALTIPLGQDTDRVEVHGAIALLHPVVGRAVAVLAAAKAVGVLPVPVGLSWQRFDVAEEAAVARVNGRAEALGVAGNVEGAAGADLLHRDGAALPDLPHV